MVVPPPQQRSRGQPRCAAAVRTGELAAARNRPPRAVPRVGHAQRVTPARSGDRDGSAHGHPRPDAMTGLAVVADAAQSIACSTTGTPMPDTQPAREWVRAGRAVFTA